MKTSSLILCSLLIVGACSKKSSVTNHSTIDNKSAIEQLNAENQQASEKLKIALEKKLESLISKENTAARAARFDEMLKAGSLAEKQLKASQFFASYELDTFASGSESTKAKLYMSVTKELTSFLNSVKKNSDNFKALAVTLNMNESLEEALGAKDSPALSAYTIVKDALSKDALKQNLDEHEKILLTKENKKLILELLKSRVTTFSEMAIENLTDKNARTFWQKVFGSKNYPETFFSSNDVTKEIALKYLTSADETKKFLGDINENFKLSKKLRKTLDKIELNGESQATDMKGREHEAFLREETLRLIDELIRE